MTEPGGLKELSALESIVVSSSALDRMIVNTMAVAGKVAGTPGKLSAVSDLDEGLARARNAIGRARI